MKIQLLVSRAGLDFSQKKGDIIEVANDEALRMIEAGQAAVVRESQKETAMFKKPTEKAYKK